MKISKKGVEQHRAAIIDAAQQLFRKRGFDNVTVAEIMSTAGFTHGGFYNHFASKEALFGEVAEAALHSVAAYLKGRRREAGGFEGYIQDYLSERHLANRKGGCPIVPLAPEAARLGETVKVPFAAGMRHFLNEAFGALEDPDAVDRSEGIATIAGLVGAMVIARSVEGADPDLATEILDATRDHLLNGRLSGPEEKSHRSSKSRRRRSPR